MHNCKLTQNNLLHLAIDEVIPPEAKQMLEELDGCPVCRDEYATLRRAWRVSAQVLKSTQPAEEFWPGYHDRLQRRLMNSLSISKPVRVSVGSRVWSGLRTMAGTSLRVPVPAALAMMLFVGILFFTQREREQPSVQPQPPSASVQTRTIEVPVIHERIVTKVVYVDKKSPRNKGVAGPSELSGFNAANSLARAGSSASGKPSISLAGFTPTEQVKLTIIKGSSPDEK